jgi:hypothetical protein
MLQCTETGIYSVPLKGINMREKHKIHKWELYLCDVFSGKFESILVIPGFHIYKEF